MTSKKQHIFIVEDEVPIARLIEIHLQQAGYQTTICGDGLEAIAFMKKNTFDALVLDRMIPGKRGLDVLRWMRGEEGALATVPVLMVTALAMMEERVRGLNEGADDYLAKPFEPEELVARVGALLRRVLSQSTASFDQQHIQLHEESMEVRIEGELVGLRPLEFKLLQTMMAKAGRVFSREALLDAVWGVDSEVEDRTVDATVKRLRKVLAEFGHGDCVQTVRGVGYRYRIKQ
ncbi:MAG: response regulator [Ghiorsea sp.]